MPASIEQTNSRVVVVGISDPNHNLSLCGCSSISACFWYFKVAFTHSLYLLHYLESVHDPHSHINHHGILASIIVTPPDQTE